MFGNISFQNRCDSISCSNPQPYTDLDCLYKFASSSLPSSVVEAPSVNTFKKRLDDWNQDVDFYSFSFSSTASTSYKLQVTS